MQYNTFLFGISKRTVFKVSKDNPDDFIDLSNFSNSDINESMDASPNVVVRLYDLKSELKTDQSDLIKYRVKLATIINFSLVKLPPCKSSFAQHVIRASLQTYIWMSFHIEKKPVHSPFQFGWEKMNGIVSINFEGQMLSEFLQR